MALSPQQIQQMVSDPAVMSALIQAVQQLGSTQSKAEIPGSVASMANKAVGVNAKIAQLLAENQQALDEMVQRGQITKDQRDQMHAQAIEKMRLDADTKERLARGRVNNAIALENAKTSSRIDTKRQLAQLEIDAIERRRLEANDLAAKAITELGPDTPIAKTIIEELGTRYEDVGGKVLASEVKSMLDDQVNSAIKGEIAKQQPQWEKLGIADRLTAKLAGSGDGPTKEAPLIDELRAAYHRGESVTDILDKQRVEAYTSKKSEAMGANAARHMDAIGASQPVADAVVSAMGKPRGSADRMAGMSKARDLARTERRNASIKTGVLGAAGAAAIGLLINKLMGSEAKESQELPLAIRMALMKQMAGGGGGDIKSQSAEAGLEGKNLLNMQRTLGILKLMQDMWSMQTPATSGYAGLV